MHVGRNRISTSSHTALVGWQRPGPPFLQRGPYVCQGVRMWLIRPHKVASMRGPDLEIISGVAVGVMVAVQVG